jgi:hypothetical protein
VQVVQDKIMAPRCRCSTASSYFTPCRGITYDSRTKKCAAHAGMMHPQCHALRACTIPATVVRNLPPKKIKISPKTVGL